MYNVYTDDKKRQNKETLKKQIEKEELWKRIRKSKKS
jgi:hypothetical protein